MTPDNIPSTTSNKSRNVLIIAVVALLTGYAATEFSGTHIMGLFDSEKPERNEEPGSYGSQHK